MTRFARFWAVALVAFALMLSLPTTAPAHKVYRYMSDGSHGDVVENNNESSALAWIRVDPHAKGSYADHDGKKKWIVLRDQRIYHLQSASTRPGAYWNEVDPKYYTKSIQYTLKHMDYPIVDDNIYGEETKEQVYDFQRWNGLADDGICGPQTYHFLSYAKGL